MDVPLPNPLRAQKGQFKAMLLKIVLNNIYEFSSCLTGNTSRLRYKAQPVNAV
jgi:hypothetical protein